MESKIRDFYNYKGLINAHKDDGFNVNENSFLYSLQNLYRKGVSEDLVVAMTSYLFTDIRWILDGKPIYRNVLEGTGHPKDFWLSRDQMISYAIFSSKFGYNAHHEIFDHLKSHMSTYDNKTGRINPLRVHMPWDYVFLGMLCNDWVSMKMANVFYWKGLHTFKYGGEAQTSGELLMYVQMKHLIEKRFNQAEYWMLRYENMLEERFGEYFWDRAFAVYFPKGHPNRNHV